jgi:hypothetical protein
LQYHPLQNFLIPFVTTIAIASIAIQIAIQIAIAKDFCLEKLYQPCDNK